MMLPQGVRAGWEGAQRSPLEMFHHLNWVVIVYKNTLKPHV